MSAHALRITPEIFQVGGSGFTADEDAAIFLVVFDGHAALIDCGCGDQTDRLLANVAAAGVRPDQIELLLLTHCHYDHTGGALGLRERLGCQVVAHELDAGYIQSGDAEVTAATWYRASPRPCPVDRRLSGSSEAILLGDRRIEALHIPGHSPGSVAFVVVSEANKVLFGQDVHGPLAESLLSNREDYVASLQRLMDIEATILCEGHLGIIKGRAKIAAFIRFFVKS